MDEDGCPYGIGQCQWFRAAYGGTHDPLGSKKPIQGIKLNKDCSPHDFPRFTNAGVVINGARVNIPPELSPYWELKATDFGPKGFPANLDHSCELDGELNDGSGAGIEHIYPSDEPRHHQLTHNGLSDARA